MTVSISAGTVQPIRFQKAMVFIDGTNLFYRLKAQRFRLKDDLRAILGSFLSGRQVVRTYLYTVQQHLNEARDIHGPHISNGIRIVLGDGISMPDGNVKEKGVDALLVADLVYHAAVKNYEYALLVSTDTDFVHALRRVEDFGCRTGVLAICADIPPRLHDVCDDAYQLAAADLEKSSKAVRE